MYSWPKTTLLCNVASDFRTLGHWLWSELKESGRQQAYSTSSCDSWISDRPNQNTVQLPLTKLPSQCLKYLKMWKRQLKTVYIKHLLYYVMSLIHVVCERRDTPGVEGVSAMGFPKDLVQVLTNTVPQNLSVALPLLTAADNKFITVRRPVIHRFCGDYSCGTVPAQNRRANSTMTW